MREEQLRELVATRVHRPQAIAEAAATRVRPTSLPWTPPEQTMEALERVEAELEGARLAVPEAAAWQKKLGADAAEVVALGLFLGRLVRVSQEYTYTTPQLEGLRAKLATTGERNVIMTTAISAPTNDEVNAAVRAAPALPFCASGWPSKVVATDQGSPGMLNRIEVMAPPKSAPQ